MKPYFIAYVKDGCGYCDRAKDLLAEKQEPYVITDLTNNEELLGDVKRVFSHETTPIVVRVDQDNSVVNLVGGYTELDSFFSQPYDEEIVTEPDSEEVESGDSSDLESD